jgi:hypothetical protein
MLMRFNRKKFKKRKRMKMLMSNKMLNKCKKKDIQMMDNMSNRNMMMSKILREMERKKLTKIKCLMLSMD